MGSGETTARAREPFKPLGQASIPLSYVFRIAHEKAACVRSNVEKAQFDSGARSRRSLLSKVREKKKVSNHPRQAAEQFCVFFIFSFLPHLLLCVLHSVVLCLPENNLFFLFSFDNKRGSGKKKTERTNQRSIMLCLLGVLGFTSEVFFFRLSFLHSKERKSRELWS